MPKNHTAALLALREGLGLTQSELAVRLGLHPRSWQEIEAGRTALKRVHELALERVALDVALERRNPMLAPPPMRRAALALARLLDEG